MMDAEVIQPRSKNMTEEPNDADGEEELSPEELDAIWEERWNKRSCLPPMGEYYALLDIADPEEVPILFRDLHEGPEERQRILLEKAARFLVEAGDTPMFSNDGTEHEQMLDHIAKGVRVEYMRAELLQDEWEPIFTLWGYLNEELIKESNNQGILDIFARKKMKTLLSYAGGIVDHVGECGEGSHMTVVGEEESEEISNTPNEELFYCEDCGAWITKESAMAQSYMVRKLVHELDPELSAEE